MAWRASSCNEEAGDGREGHEDGGGEAGHVTEDAGGDGGEVVGDGEGENEGDGVASPAGQGEQGGEEGKAGAGEKEVGATVEERAVGNGGAGEGGGREGEGVVHAIAEVEGGLQVADEGRFLVGIERGVGVFGCDPESLGKLGDDLRDLALQIVSLQIVWQMRRGLTAGSDQLP